MAFKQLGAVNISSTSTETTLYTVPAGKQAVVSGLSMCNQSSSVATYRVSHIPSGQSVGAAYYLKKDETIPALPASKEKMLNGITMAAGDIISVYSTVANVNFVLHGDEQSI